MLCTPWLRNPLTISRLFASAASDLGDNFSLGSSKYDFAALTIHTKCPRTRAPEKKGEIFIKGQMKNFSMLNGIQEKNSLIRPIKAF
jgi:hypothetical protein